jgi:hypothetical protein
VRITSLQKKCTYNPCFILFIKVLHQLRDSYEGPEKRGAEKLEQVEEEGIRITRDLFPVIKSKKSNENLRES